MHTYTIEVNTGRFLSINEFQKLCSFLSSVPVACLLDSVPHHFYQCTIFFSWPYLCCSSVASSIYERDDEVPTTTAVATSRMSSQPLSRRTRTLKGDSQFGVRGLTNGSYRTASNDEGYDFATFPFIDSSWDIRNSFSCIKINFILSDCCIVTVCLIVGLHRGSHSVIINNEITILASVLKSLCGDSPCNLLH